MQPQYQNKQNEKWHEGFANKEIQKNIKIRLRSTKDAGKDDLASVVVINVSQDNWRRRFKNKKTIMNIHRMYTRM